jgi:hypothetical protein
MLSNLKNLFTNMTWYLRSGIAPSRIQKNDFNFQKLKNINHMSSKKFAMTMVAVSIIAFMYFASVLFLFLLPNDPQVSGLVNMYKDMIVAIAAIVASLVGIQGLVDWKYNGSSDVVNISETSKEIITEEYLSGPKEEDYILEIEPEKNRRR